MPRVSFTEEHKVQKSGYDFPRLKLQTGEKARIAIVEDPVVEYRHTIDIPRVASGRVETREVPTRDGGSYTDYVRDFVSTPLCTGDEDVLSESGLDVDGCLVCAYAAEHKDRVKPPQRRYAMHVIRYKTKPGTATIGTPFSVDLIVWAFPDNTFNKITDFNQEWAESGGLKAHDLIITCKVGAYQNYEFSVAPDAAWQKSDKTKELVKETFDNNQIPDLTVACGSRKQEQWIKDDLSKVTEAWDLVNRIQSDDDEDEGSLEEGLDGLLDSSKPAEDEVEETPEEDAPEAEEKPKKESAPAKKKSGGNSFDDLFA